MNIVQHLYKEANKLKQCGAVKGKETPEELVHIIMNTTAMKFCLINKFPTMKIWNELDKSFNISRFKIYIDKNNTSIELTSKEDKCMLVGNVKYTVKCSGLRPFRIFAMHGAEVEIIGDKNAVIFIDDDGTCKYNEILNNGAITIFYGG